MVNLKKNIIKTLNLAMKKKLTIDLEAENEENRKFDTRRSH